MAYHLNWPMSQVCMQKLRSNATPWLGLSMDWVHKTKRNEEEKMIRKQKNKKWRNEKETFSNEEASQLQKSISTILCSFRNWEK